MPTKSIKRTVKKTSSTSKAMKIARAKRLARAKKIARYGAAGVAAGATVGAAGLGSVLLANYLLKRKILGANHIKPLIGSQSRPFFGPPKVSAYEKLKRYLKSKTGGAKVKKVHKVHRKKVHRK